MLHTTDTGKASRQEGPGPPPLPENLLGMQDAWAVGRGCQSPAGSGG